MNKWTNIRIGEYEIVNPDKPEDPQYEYETIEIDTLLQRTNTNQSLFMNTYSAVNIHKLLCEETFDDCMSLLRGQLLADIEGLNAIVFLLLKPKGDRNTYHQIRELDKYKRLINLALDNQLDVGFDSCSATSFLQVIEGRENYKKLAQLAEPCESSLFSIYIDVNAQVFPCSFAAGTPGWEEGINLLTYDSLEEVWHHPRLESFRATLLANDRACPIYDLTMR